MRGFDRRWGRSGAGLTRAERAALARRERAAAHLARMQGRVPGAASRPWRAPRVAALGATALPLLLGIALAEPVAGAAGRWLAGDASLSAIHVRGARRLSAAEVAAATGVAPGTPLAHVDAGVAAARLAEHPWVAEAHALRLATGDLLVEVVERVPAALALTPRGGEAFAVDEAGTAFAAAEPGDHADLPRLHGVAALNPGEPNPVLARAVQLAHRMGELGFDAPVEIEIPAPGDREGFAVHLPGLTPRIVLGNDDLDERLARLRRLLDAGLPDLSSATSVDLRFADQAVLRREPLPQGAAQEAARRGRGAPSEIRPAG